MRFSERYADCLALRDGVREEAPPIREEVVQCIWYERLFSTELLETTDGRLLRIVSPGWWNHGEGPDFKGAQLELDGSLVTGDVEIDLAHTGWHQHGHFADPRYNDVILVAVFEHRPPAKPPRTAEGRPFPCLLLPQYIEESPQALAERIQPGEYPYQVTAALGHCAVRTAESGGEQLETLVRLAGEWRMLGKARALRERIEYAGMNQAVYEAFLYACGFGPYKHHFHTIARQLHYERAVQLIKQDPLLLEAAFLVLAGLFPDSLPEPACEHPHWRRLEQLRTDHLSGMKPLKMLTWNRAGVRPANYPERRLAGAARFLARTAQPGLTGTLESIWAQVLTPVKRRQAFEALFPKRLGFWSARCTWTGKALVNPIAPIGANRVRAIIGNVFIPAALALARSRKDRLLEESVLAFFAAMPKEADNRIIKIMVPRIFGMDKPPRIDFRLQQGLLQMYTDFCEPNPSCRNCPMLAYLAVNGQDAAAAKASTS